MEHHPNEFHKILRQVMSQEPKPLLSEEEIHFEMLSIKVLELVGEKLSAYSFQFSS